ncbi:unnamed protein product [Polarella glacialis]|uniref:Uncharacterized protein n=1 Tax=Polarella glacialis TaxID=89957 RepID=A0A813GLQ8_POLGL|nr:unnamed protein product [Polarella glacialis]
MCATDRSEEKAAVMQVTAAGLVQTTARPCPQDSTRAGGRTGRHRPRPRRGSGRRLGDEGAMVQSRNSSGSPVPSSAVERVLKMMAAAEEEEQVQETGCKAFVDMAEAGSEQQSEIGLPGVQAVVKAMEIHAESAEVQTNGVHALQRIAAFNGRNTMSLVKAGGVQATVKAMMSLKSVQLVQVQEVGWLQDPLRSDDLQCSVPA